MTAQQKTALRARTFTYYEVLAFAQFYLEHRNENSPQNLLAAFLEWRQSEAVMTATDRRLQVIEEAVTRYYGLVLADVRGKRRYTELVRARQVIFHLAVQDTKASQQKIAEMTGKKREDVQYGKTKCAQLMETEPLLRKEVAEIEGRIAYRFKQIEAELKELERKTIKQNEDEKSN
jgi:chromosomal replication initiation ATPase DnaA